MSSRHLAVVMPAYNEAEGIPVFIAEIIEHVEPLVEKLDIVVVNDVSTDDTEAVLSQLSAADPRIHVQTSPKNQGHGPTALAAYRAGLALDPDILLHVDGDGQFLGEDIARVVTVFANGDAEVVHGVRRHRTDPWFRRVLTAGVRGVVMAVARRGIADVNTPLRVYRPDVAAALVSSIPATALVPHVHFSLAEARARRTVEEIPVRSIPRRGSVSTGTMWGTQREPLLPPKRLRDFSRKAAAELWAVSLRPGRR